MSALSTVLRAYKPANQEGLLGRHSRWGGCNTIVCMPVLYNGIKQGRKHIFVNELIFRGL